MDTGRYYQDMAGTGTEPEWELHYWPIAGRGEFPRLVFEEAGIPFKNVGENVMENIIKGQMDSYPAFAPPLLKRGDFSLSQTQVICKYLGKQFGMYPETEPDIWHADQLNATIHDYIGEGRLVFHGKGFVMSYHDQTEETKPYIEWFIKERMDRWLPHFEKCLKANNNGNGFLVGEKITYVDLGMLHVLRATEAQFTDKWNSMENIPLLKAFKQRIETRPKLAAYFKSDRCQPFSGNSMM